MKKSLMIIVLVVAGIVGLAAIGAAFTVHQTQQAIVFQFGDPKRVLKEAGLYFKIPFIQDVSYMDKRILDLDSPVQEVIASDQKRLVVDAFARFKISDPLRFYQSVGNEQVARSRLATVLNSSTRRVLGESSFEAVVRDSRSDLMNKIATQMNAEAAKFGIEIVDVKIRRADLPQANSEAIYRRMQTERQREASEFRAQGQEQSQRIRSRADREVTVLKAEATRDAEKLRGEGDSERNQIFADAYGRDPDFFKFYRSMQAYEKSLEGGDTTLVLTPDSEFFRFFRGSSGKEGGQPAAQ